MKTLLFLEIDFPVVQTCIFITIARILDVTIGTLRTIFLFRGKRLLPTILAFVEIMVWVFSMSKVVTNLDKIEYAISFAFGFALGNYVGISIERYIAMGKELCMLFTRKGAEVAEALRMEGFAVTSFEGAGKTGPVSIILVQTNRRLTQRMLDAANRADGSCYYVISDVKTASTQALRNYHPTGWRAVFKKK
ncbi:MAG: DUF5698 domain-containing protein [Planctomycetes bacterium]|nr:DUF5698 domain-containing protein [Planctomycetota bacterium]